MRDELDLITLLGYDRVSLLIRSFVCVWVNDASFRMYRSCMMMVPYHTYHNNMILLL